MRMTQKVLVLTLILGMVFSQAVYAGSISMKLDGYSQNGSKGKTALSIDVSTVAAGLEHDQYTSNSATATIRIVDRASGKHFRIQADGSIYAIPENRSRKNGVGSFFGFSDSDGIENSGDEYTVSFTMYQNWHLTGKKSYVISIDKYNPQLAAYENMYKAPLTPLKSGTVRVRYSE